MRKPPFIGILSVLILTTLASCGPSIEISNKTSALVFVTLNDGAETSISNGSKLTKEFNGSPNAEVTVKGTGSFVLDFTNKILLKPGNPHPLELKANAGRLKLANQTSGGISAYYISASTNAGWGSSLGTLNIFGEKSFRLSEGLWDIWVVTSTGANLYKLKNYVALDSELSLSISTSTNSGFSSAAPLGKSALLP